MKHLNKQLTAIASILIFSIGLMLSSNVFAGKPLDARYATQDDFDTAVTDLQSQIDLLNTRYSIGDIGPAGGIVFYVTALGYHGLEVAPENQGGGLWGCYYTEITGADGIAVGTGTQNTVDILAGCNDPNRPPEAAELADNYVLNGYTDWFLPSIDALNELYQSAVVVSSFSPWSSTESNDLSYPPDQFAMIVNFSNGFQGPQPKNTPMLVHPIRAF